MSKRSWGPGSGQPQKDIRTGRCHPIRTNRSSLAPVSEPGTVGSGIQLTTVLRFIDIAVDALEVPEPLHAVAAATGADPVSFVLAGGEDHSLLATFAEGVVPEGWRVIGSVADGEGVTVDGAAYDGPTGWTHF